MSHTCVVILKFEESENPSKQTYLSATSVL